MADVTFEWYAGAFGGVTIPDEDSFKSVIMEAEAYIENITRGRTAENAGDAVKKAICSVAEVIYNQAHDNDATVSSESVGNHSKSYTKKTVSTAEREAEKARKARLYLSRTGLLYGGMH